MTAPRGPRGWDLAASCLLLGVPVVRHLDFHQVPLWTPDAIGLLAGPLLPGVLIGWLLGRVPPWLRVGLFGALTVVFLDLTLPSGLARFRYVVPAAFLAAWIFRTHYARLATVTLAALLASLAIPHDALRVREWKADSGNPDSAARGLVPILHIVLDEHAAPKAFPADIPEAVRAREVIRAFYRKHDFRLFENAYSRYFWTQTAIPATLDEAGSAAEAPPARLRDGKVFLLRSSVFDRARRSGYRIRVFETQYLDVCGATRASITSCRSYPAVTLESLRRARLDFPHRLLLEYAHFFSSQSHVVRAGLSRLRQRAWSRVSPEDPATSLPYWALDEPHVTTALHELRDLREAAGRDLDRSLIFAHVVLPHSPYEVDRDCRQYPWPRDYLRRWSGRNRSNTPAARRLRWSLYSRQVECLYLALDSLVSAVVSAAPPQGMLMVLQGDHGSRIVEHHPRLGPSGEVGDQDLLDGFATLLAVRGPGIAAGPDYTPVAVQAFVPRLLAGTSPLDSLTAAPAPVPVIYLDRSGPRPGAVPHRAPVLGRFQGPGAPVAP